MHIIVCTINSVCSIIVKNMVKREKRVGRKSEQLNLIFIIINSFAKGNFGARHLKNLRHFFPRLLMFV